MSWANLAHIPAGGGGGGPAPPGWAIALIVVASAALPAFILVGVLLDKRRRRLAHETNVASGVTMAAKIILLAQRGNGNTGPSAWFDVTLEVAHPAGAFVIVLPVVFPLQALSQLQVGTVIPVRVAAADNVEIVMPGVTHS